MTHVVVQQISSRAPNGAYFNVDEKLGSVSVQAWLSSSYPTIVVQEGRHVRMIQFDDEETFKEFLVELRQTNPTQNAVITVLNPST